MQDVTLSELRAEIDAVNARFIEAVRRGDAAGIAACYADDAAILPPGSEMVRGREGIEAFWRAFIAIGVAAELRTKTLELEGDGDRAAEVATYMMVAENGGTVDVGKYIVLWRRQDGEWKLFRDIWNSSLPTGSA
jgi:uncharacterized protein (TIGR02246 family)